MKPEELDELFRRGLADQQSPPRPSAWADVQQRMATAAAAAADDDADDELPAFLRSSEIAAPRAAPFMTASRGGGALGAARPAPMAAPWWQRPALRAAAAVLLFVGGGALMVQQNATEIEEGYSTITGATSPVRDVLNTVAVAPSASSVRPAALTTMTPPSSVTPNAPNALKNAPAETATEGPSVAMAVEVKAPVTASASARTGSVVASASARRTSRAAAASATTSAAPTRPVAEEVAGTNPAADPLNEAVIEITIRPAPEAVAHSAGFRNVSANDLADRTATADDERNLPVDGNVGQWVARATGRELRIANPHSLLRRALGQVRQRLDGADDRADGQLTLETNVAGRPIRKTISL